MVDFRNMSASKAERLAKNALDRLEKAEKKIAALEKRVKTLEDQEDSSRAK